MKYFLPTLCAFLLLGCSESKPTESSAVSSNEPQSVATPIPEENISQPVQEVPSEQTLAPSPVAIAPAAPAPVAEKPVAAATPDGSILFAQKCASCHGKRAEKSALGNSLIIAGWEEEKIKDALKGYQAGTYGKAMKAVMHGQASPLSDEQINALGKYISQL
ncbi:c-type cytochrome [Sulfuricurvum sp.]|uniref:c-type cytochrome n=1 Tax=Sulfuricurvum sp. TaxID=2025608 RepID=UPI003BAE45F4